MNNEKNTNETPTINEKNINKELIRFKKINNRNSGMIIVLLGMLLFVCVICVYVRFLGWFFSKNILKYI